MVKRKAFAIVPLSRHGPALPGDRMRYNIYVEAADGVRVGYKVVEILGGRVLSLFHGTNRSRVIPLGVWYRARIEQVTDGNNTRYYQSGWHYFDSEAGALDFFSTLKVKSDRFVIRCYVRGNIRRKWSGKCMLSDEIMIKAGDNGII